VSPEVYKSLWTLIATEQYTRNFLDDWELAIVMFHDLFFSFWLPLLWGVITFSNLLSFLTIFSAWNTLIGMVQVCLNTKNNGTLPLDLACPERLNVWSPVYLPYLKLPFINSTHPICTSFCPIPKLEAGRPQWTSTSVHHISTGWPLWLCCGWTSTELIFGFTLVINSVRNR